MFQKMNLLLVHTLVTRDRVRILSLPFQGGSPNPDGSGLALARTHSLNFWIGPLLPSVGRVKKLWFESGEMHMALAEGEKSVPSIHVC